MGPGLLLSLGHAMDVPRQEYHGLLVCILSSAMKLAKTVISHLAHLESVPLSLG